MGTNDALLRNKLENFPKPLGKRITLLDSGLPTPKEEVGFWMSIPEIHKKLRGMHSYTSTHRLLSIGVLGDYYVFGNKSYIKTSLLSEVLERIEIYYDKLSWVNPPKPKSNHKVKN